MGGGLYNNYTMFCAGTGRAMMNNPLTPGSSDDEIRRYMFGEHNSRTIQAVHRAVPYHISDPKLEKLVSSGMMQVWKGRGIILPDKLDEIVVLHVGLPVDTMTVEQLKQYIPDESFGLWQSAA